MGYSREKNVQLLLYLLKAHGIKKIIVSPGATNISIVNSLQHDSFFELFSAYDERSAAYMAVGLARSSGEPVGLSCTGATASRNYTPGLTEAFYKTAPVLVITSSQESEKMYQYFPQLTDRTQQFNDMVFKSIQVPVIKSDKDIFFQETEINMALLDLIEKKGPVHINLITDYNNNFDIKELPSFRKIERYHINDEFPKIISGKIAIFIGAHVPFSTELELAIDSFCSAYNALVIGDHTSNYKGKYKLQINLLADQDITKDFMKFDLVIHIGYVSGAYIKFYSKEIWRVNPDGMPRDLYRRVTKIFAIQEIDFFKHYNSELSNADNSFFLLYKKELERIYNRIPELPFSNNWIAKNTSNIIPKDSVIHFAILNSLRSWNHFEIPNSVFGYANTGGFGIDGCVSSLIGASLAHPEKKYFGIFGDLAFFYDINSITINYIRENLRIMIINNGIGIEFRNYNHRAFLVAGKSVDDFIAAGGHNGPQSGNIIKDLADQFGFRYLSAKSKEEYLKKVKIWIGDSSKPIIFEIFVSCNDESESLRLLNTINGSHKKKMKLHKKILKKIVTEKMIQKLKKFVNSI